MTLFTLTPRPSQFDEPVTRTAALQLLPDVLRWMKNNSSPGDQEIDAGEEKDIVNDLVDAMSFDLDSFEICKKLERNHYWGVDRDLIDVMDDAMFAIIKARDGAVKEWVTANGIKPELAIGTRVTFNAQFKQHTGEITKVDEVMAQYLVFCESRGDVRSGNGTHGSWVPYENVKLIEQQPVAVVELNP